MTSAEAELDTARAVRSHPLWYHTMDLGPGISTSGWFDLRPIVDRMPWPDVRGKRCLDVGPFDGFLSFELERRGAAEVVAADIGDHSEWDWPANMRDRAEELEGIAGPAVGAGFSIAKQALGSSVERIEMSVYELDPERIGSFDVVVCGSLLLHLRDPVRALEAIRGVCSGVLLSAETISLPLTALRPRTPAAELIGVGKRCQWWIPNPAAQRRMLVAAGYGIEFATRPYAVPFGPAHPARQHGWRTMAGRLLSPALPGWPGVPHVAALARPRA